MRRAARTPALLLTAVLAVSAPVMTACGGVANQAVEQAAEQAAEQAVGGDVDIEDGQVTVTDESGNAVSVGEDVALPDTWPAVVPTVGTGKLMAVSVQADGSANAMWSTEGTPQEAADAYATALTEAGYTEASNSSMSGMIVAEYTGKGYTVSVNSLDVDGTTNVMVTAVPE